MSTAAQLRSVATTMTGREMAEASRKTAAEAGSATVKKFFEANRGTLEALLPKHFDSERMLKLALGALRTTPKLAGASLSSLLGSVVTCAQLGLEPNTPLGHAYLLPFDKREKRDDGQWVTVETQVQVIIGWKGMVDLARRSGQIVSIAAHEVCEGDDFRFAYGLDEELYHRPAMKDRGAVIGFYAVAKLVGGGHSFEFMSCDEVNHIRYKAAEKNRAKKDKQGRPIITGPWLDNYVEMGRKTVLRRLFKYLPISIESLAFASAIDGNAVAAAAPLEEVVFDVGQQQEGPADFDQETGEILESAPAKIAHQPEPERIPQQTRQTEREPVRQQRQEAQAHQQSEGAAGGAGQWQPSPDELAEIEARERAEAGGQSEQRQAAPAGRRPRGQMNLD